MIDKVLTAIYDGVCDVALGAKKMWDETPRTVVSETERRARKMHADELRFKYILDNGLCGCPNCAKDTE